MIRYIITGVDSEGNRINLFKDNRSFLSKHYAKKTLRDNQSWMEGGAYLELEEIEILSYKELEKELEELRVKCEKYEKALKYYSEKGEEYGEGVTAREALAEIDK